MQIKSIISFGYGLSYSDFKYSDFKIDKEITKDNKITVKVSITNIGELEASEVVMLFVENNESSVYKPLRELRNLIKLS